MRERSLRELAQALVLLLSGACTGSAPPDAAAAVRPSDCSGPGDEELAGEEELAGDEGLEPEPPLDDALLADDDEEALPAPGFRACGANGGFSGEVVARFLGDGRRMRLESSFGYVDPDGALWPAPEGVVVDGASIPRCLWTVVGSPFVGEYREASVVHDVACDERTRPWRDVHRMFYQACLCGGVGRIRAKVLFSAVHHFGPRWDTSGMLLPSTLTEEEEEERFERMAAYIEANDPDLEGIEDFDP